MKISQLRTTPLAIPLKEPYHWAGRCDVAMSVVLVEVEADEGIVGIGESRVPDRRCDWFPPSNEPAFCRGIPF
jgi:L-alanine-DL-glutamate epimerase-like enolase superfamily enzyme